MVVASLQSLLTLFSLTAAFAALGANAGTAAARSRPSSGLSVGHVSLTHRRLHHPSSRDICTMQLGNKGTAGPDDPYWLEAIKHQGTSPVHPDPGNYQVFRNVKDFGAVGDGVTDDSAAINNAISSGGRCGEGTCGSSTVSPALVYFPKGTYFVSQSIKTYYYTQLIGDATSPPTLLASPDFTDYAVIDADPYIPNGGGNQWFINQVNFFRSIRNFVIDVRQVPPENASGTGIHWQVSQATSLMNIVVHMSDADNTAHRGIYMENGSGGYMGDLVFNGGNAGISGGNQQFTVKNVTINNAKTGVISAWNWGWTWQGITIRNCQVGFDISIGGVGAQAIIDATVLNTPIFLQVSAPSDGTLATSLFLQNAKLRNVPVAVGLADGTVVLAGTGGGNGDGGSGVGVSVGVSGGGGGVGVGVNVGGGGETKTIQSWGQGNVYKGDNPQGQFVQGDLQNAQKPSDNLLDDNSGKVVSRMHPQYESFLASDFVSVKDFGAKGDGVTDDTQAIQTVLTKFAGCKIVFFDAGQYIVTDTVYIPPNTRMVGEAWTVLAGTGPAFQDQNNPTAVFQVGKPHEIGVMEISDIIFSTVGSAAGAIVVEWNIREPVGSKAGAALWDSHIRTGGAAGSKLQQAQCPKDGSGGFDNCFAAFLNLHITKYATAYIEGAWVWLADHDLDGDSQITVYSGRGILSESEGPVWLVGTGSEHHVLYQYRLSGAKDHYMGLIQTETPYYQPTPAPPAPFALNPTYHDPEVYNDDPDSTPSAWALSIQQSTNIYILGAGLYSFFKNYAQDCIDARNCQTQIADIDSESAVQIFSLSTVAAAKQVSVDGKGVVDQGDNLNGFVSTVTYWCSG